MFLRSCPASSPTAAATTARRWRGRRARYVETISHKTITKIHFELFAGRQPPLHRGCPPWHPRIEVRGHQGIRGGARLLRADTDGEEGDVRQVLEKKLTIHISLVFATVSDDLCKILFVFFLPPQKKSKKSLESQAKKGNGRSSSEEFTLLIIQHFPGSPARPAKSWSTPTTTTASWQGRRRSPARCTSRCGSRTRCNWTRSWSPARAVGWPRGRRWWVGSIGKIIATKPRWNCVEWKSYVKGGNANDVIKISINIKILNFTKWGSW